MLLNKKKKETRFQFNPWLRADSAAKRPSSGGNRQLIVFDVLKTMQCVNYIMFSFSIKLRCPMSFIPKSLLTRADVICIPRMLEFVV